MALDVIGPDRVRAGSPYRQPGAVIRHSRTNTAIPIDICATSFPLSSGLLFATITAVSAACHRSCRVFAEVHVLNTGCLQQERDHAQKMSGRSSDTLFGYVAGRFSRNDMTPS